MSTSNHGFQIKYPAITLHAISRAESPPSIYCQLDDRAGDVENLSLRQDDDESDVRELIIIPADDTSRECIVLLTNAIYLRFISGTNLPSPLAMLIAASRYDH
jgi:hypothetical protein